VILEGTSRQLTEMAARGIRPKLWLRDDDFCKFTPNFQSLCTVLEYGMPLVISAVPYRLRLSQDDKIKLSRKPGNLSFCVHGYNHANNGAIKGGPSEFPADRDIQAVRKELEFGVAQIMGTFAQKFLPIFVPPWNYVAAEYLPILKDLGIKIVSGAKSRAQPEIDGIRGLHIDIDLLDYPPTPPYPMKRVDVLDAEFMKAIDGWQEKTPVIGVLSHHTGMTQSDITIYNAIVRELCTFCDPLDLAGFLNGPE